MEATSCFYHSFLRVNKCTIKNTIVLLTRAGDLIHCTLHLKTDFSEFAVPLHGSPLMENCFPEYGFYLKFRYLSPLLKNLKSG